MVVKEVRPYGEWESPITADSVAFGVNAMSAPRACKRFNLMYYVESDETGRKTIMQVDGDQVKSILPQEYSASNQVYEYGAQPLDTLADGRVIFTNSDNTIRIVDPRNGQVQLLVESPVLRYAAYNAHPNSPWVLAIEEDHTKTGPYEVENYIVAINTETAEVKRVISGADFYYAPTFNRDGSRVAWLQWDHPQMMFIDAQLYLGLWNTDATISQNTFVIGDNHESVGEPRWGFDGSLFFCQEVHDYRQLFRIAPGSNIPKQITLVGLESSEIGEVSLGEGSCTYVPLSERHIIAATTHNGVVTLIAIDLQTNEWRDVGDSQEICSMGGSCVARWSDSTALVIAAGRKSFQAAYKIDIKDAQKSKLLRSTSDTTYPAALISAPETIEIQSKGSPSRSIYGFYHAPRNPRFVGPQNELPPLVIWAHGGPTGHNRCSLRPDTQYLTSRGYAYLLLNYTGSTGHGRKYREALSGNWGVVDADDVAEFAHYLMDTKRVRRGAVGITGISAGGYNTLQCITRHPELFAGGVCVSGISDLAPFSATTHKLESDYVDLLIFEKGLSEDEKNKRLYDRSACNNADKIVAPLLLIHAMQDTVVPLKQAQLIADIMRKKGRTVKLIEVPDEGHSVGKPENAKMWIEEEEKWWKKTLLH